MRVWQLIRSKWLRWRCDRKDRGELRGRGELILSRRLLAYSVQLKGEYALATARDDKTGIVYYLAQMRLCEWLVGGGDPTLKPVLKTDA